MDDAEADLGYPCFVKPANMGSSVGRLEGGRPPSCVEVCAGAELRRVDPRRGGDRRAARSRSRCSATTRRRRRCPARSCPATSSTPTPTSTSRTTRQLLAPAPLTDDQTRRAQELAVRAFEACRCEAMARVDLFFEEQGRGFLVNEVNTIPGFTPISMYPRLWEASGLAYPQLLDRLIELALARQGKNAASRGPPGSERPQPGIPAPESERRVTATSEAASGLDRERTARSRVSRLAESDEFYLTTGQVKVRVMPSTFWISETTSLPRSSRVTGLPPLDDHVVGPATLSAVDDPGDGPRRLGAPSSDRPTSVWMSTCRRDAHDFPPLRAGPLGPASG